MSERQPAARYELKMTFDPTWIEEVRGWIVAHSSAFAVAYPPRWVNSVYFDTPDLDCYNDHLAGVPERRKLRFRWYGPSLLKARGQVEVKNKRERVGWKIIQPVDREFDLGSLSWAEVLDGLRRRTDGIVRELLWVARPLVLTVYSREYLVSADGLVRLTIDTDLQAYEQLFTSRPNLWFRQPVEPSLIVELKSDVAHASRLADILAHFPQRANRRSKFVDSLGFEFVK